LDIEDNIRMCGDPVRLRQMVSIFLDNATQYTPDCGSISLRMKKAAHFIEIVIADSGIGFENSEKDKIFNRFYRVDKARSRKQGGTGLGLAIAAWIVEQYKGRIEVASKAGEGSIFKVLLPLS
jgi:signal transduction histidine kinase